ncbi:uncharacterized protein SAPINGB_P001442 [Magnusiomyces paraingens]|uniref:methionyl-tRNA formyltransferase n=1 Tax=Magnusiomyces paraingens TaxID=2606893 RepID=A0A5E8BBW5_9ASCO|nr:uncharacterized protein SAPINGB_P001442 [Saprochaete ingens]VVT46898.1 unnamed protein product [Saprochaete ingens]
MSVFLLSQRTAINYFHQTSHLFISRSFSSKLLKIAFCGSDLFSIHSFKALLQYAATPQAIQSIDLITRKPKPAGRGRKTIATVPILEQLPELQQIYSSTGPIQTHTPESTKEFLDIQAARNFDIVIAVSYGKLIPHQFIAALPYGGLNVHPSLLPKYSGASPLHMALLNRDPYTGVTVQTLHPTKFDRGDILFQSPELPLPQLLNQNHLSSLTSDEAILAADSPLAAITDTLGVVGAQALVHVIKNGLYESPANNKLTPKYDYSYAPRIPSTAAEIHLSSMDTTTILVNNKVLGPLYIFQETIPPLSKKMKKKLGNETSVPVPKRVQLHLLENASQSFPNEFPEQATQMALGDYFLTHITDKSTESDSALVFKTSDGFIAARQIKSEGYAACSAYQLALSMKKRGIFRNSFIL